MAAGVNQKAKSKVSSEPSHVVMITALAVHDYGNGVFGIELPGRVLTEEQRAVLREMYPNLIQQAEDLLNQEMLLASLAKDLPPCPPGYPRHYGRPTGHPINQEGETRWPYHQEPVGQGDDV